MTGKLKPFINSSNDQKRVEENVSHTTVDMKISIKFKKEKCEIYSITRAKEKETTFAQRSQ